MLFREGLRRILYEADFQPVWCSDVPPAGPLPSLPQQSSPLLIIGGDIGDASLYCAQIKRYYPHARVVLLSDSLRPGQFAAALRQGAQTVVLKRSSCEGLIASLRLVAGGSVVFPADMMDELLSSEPAPDLSRRQPAEKIILAGTVEALGLSARELGVLDHLSHGLSNKEIARVLNIAEATVKVHVKAILRKSRTRNRTQVATWASRQVFRSSVAVPEGELIAEALAG